jgi:hypothetical protein
MPEVLGCPFAILLLLEKEIYCDGCKSQPVGMRRLGSTRSARRDMVRGKTFGRGKIDY